MTLQCLLEVLRLIPTWLSSWRLNFWPLPVNWAELFQKFWIRTNRLRWTFKCGNQKAGKFNGETRKYSLVKRVVFEGEAREKPGHAALTENNKIIEISFNKNRLENKITLKGQKKTKCRSTTKFRTRESEEPAEKDELRVNCFMLSIRKIGILFYELLNSL